MSKALRKKKVMIDWSQNTQSKTTVCVYSMRAKRDEPFISMEYLGSFVFLLVAFPFSSLDGLLSVQDRGCAAAVRSCAVCIYRSLLHLMLPGLLLGTGPPASAQPSATSIDMPPVTSGVIERATTLGPGRGVIRIYVDGVLKLTKDTYAATTRYRYVVYSIAWASSLRLLGKLPILCRVFSLQAQVFRRIR
jgi:hypothetical protein